MKSAKLLLVLVTFAVLVTVVTVVAAPQDQGWKAWGWVSKIKEKIHDIITNGWALAYLLAQAALGIGGLIVIYKFVAARWGWGVAVLAVILLIAGIAGINYFIDWLAENITDPTYVHDMLKWLKDIKDTAWSFVFG